VSSGLRIAFIGTRGVPALEGGIERHVEELGSRLAARGHEVTVYCRNNYVLERAPTYRGMHLKYVRAIGTKNLDFIAHSALSTLLTLRSSPDIVHYHAIGSALVAPIPRYLTRSGIVLTVHGLDYARAKWGRAARATLKLAAGMSARVPHATIVVSRALADHYANHLGRSADYIANGMPEATLRSLGPMAERLGLRERPYFLFVGRLVPEKAPDLLIRAFAKVRADARLVIVGSSGFTDTYAESLRRLAATDPRVIFAGGVYGDELAELYSNAAAFVLPSSLEGLPITLLVVEENGPGHRVVRQGDLDALAAAMELVLADRKGEMVGARALGGRVAQTYSWDAAATATERVYERVLRLPASRVSARPIR